MKLFESPKEKGTREWKSVGNILRERRTDLYPTAKPRVVHLRVRQGTAFHQQFFILKNAH